MFNEPEAALCQLRVGLSEKLYEASHRQAKPGVGGQQA